MKLNKIKKSPALGFFNYTLRQNKQQILLFLIITLLIMVIPTYIMTEDAYDSFHRYEFDSEELRLRVTNIFESTIVLGYVVTAIMAFVAGMTTLSYVNSKKNIGCFHSFPVRRETIYLSETVIRIVFFLAASAVGYLSCYAVITTKLECGDFYADLYMKFWIVAVLGFLLIYTTFLLGAGLTGTGPMRFIMTALIAFLPVASYAMFFVLASLNSNLQGEAYMTYDVIRALCPFIGLGIDFAFYIDGTTAFSKCYLVLIPIVLFYVGGLLLHKFRKSESSGTTVIWKPILHITKYATIFLTSMLGCYLFDVTFGSGRGDAMPAIMGTLIGAVLAMIVLNSILYKSTRSAFKDIKGFGIAAVALVLFTIFVPINATGQIGEPYPAAHTRKITIALNNAVKVTYTDREDIDKIFELMEKDENSYLSEDSNTSFVIRDPETLKVLEESYWNFSKYTYDDNSGETYYRIDTSYSTSVDISQYPYVGIPLHAYRTFRLGFETWNYIISTEEYAQSVDTSHINPEDVYRISYSLPNDYVSWHNENTLTDAEFVRDILAAAKYDPESSKNYPHLAVVRINYFDHENGYTNTVAVPVYADNVDIYNAASRNIFFSGSEYDSCDDYYDAIVQSVNAAIILDSHTGFGKTLNKSLLRELIPDLSSIKGSYSSTDDGFGLSGKYDYVLIMAYNTGETKVSYFREGATANEELKSIYDSLD